MLNDALYEANRKLLEKWRAEKRFPFEMNTPVSPILSSENIESIIKEKFGRIPLRERIVWMFTTGEDLEAFNHYYSQLSNKSIIYVNI